MRPSKQRRKANRRGSRQLDEAWRAFADGQPELARKIAARAVAATPGNPHLCNEHGLLLQAIGASDAAAEAFRLALKLAPDYAEAAASLAALGGGDAHAAPAPALEIDPDGETVAPVPAPPPRIAPWLERFVWDGVAQELRDNGGAVLSELFDGTERAALRCALSGPQAREFTVSLADEERGRFFRSILQTGAVAGLERLRQELYVACAQLANRQNEALRRRDRFPGTLGELKALCRTAGQLWSATALLEFPPAGFASLRREPSQSLQFPLQVFVDLGPDPDWCEHRLADLRPGKRLHERTFRTRPGDALILCTRDRLERVAGVFGLQAVMHGVNAGDAPRAVLQFVFEDRR